MTYHYECDGFCERGAVRSGRPALTGEFSEQFVRSTQAGGDVLEHGYEEGDLITLCPECTRRLLIEHP